MMFKMSKLFLLKIFCQRFLRLKLTSGNQEKWLHLLKDNIMALVGMKIQKNNYIIKKSQVSLLGEEEMRDKIKCTLDPRVVYIMEEV